MIQHNIIKNGDFGVAKASRKFKTTIIALPSIVAALSPVIATAASPSECFLSNEQSSYSQAMQSESNNSALDSWNYLLERTVPNEAGVEHLDGKEQMGLVYTPIIYSEYSELANPVEGSAKVEVFRNPLSKDGIVVMATSETIKRNSAFESIFTPDKFDLSTYKGKAARGLVEEDNEWYPQSLEKKEISQLRNNAIEKVNLVIEGLESDNMKAKFGVRARKNITGGFTERYFEVLKPAILGLESGVAKNPGGSLFFDDGAVKVNISSLYSGGAVALKASMTAESVKETVEFAEDISADVRNVLTKDYLPIDRGITSGMSYKQKLEISNTTALIHEVFHGVVSYSTNSAQPSLIFNAFNKTYDNGSAGEDGEDLKIGKIDIFDMGTYRLNHESASDVAVIMIAASGADAATWEYVKLLQQSVRMHSYVHAMIVAPTENPDFTMDISEVNRSTDEGVEDLFQNHDVSFLVNGWVLALEDARNGDDPNNLLSLASQPVKMSMAIQFANAIILKKLEQMTSGWETLPKDQYDDLIEKGTGLMQNYVKSRDFKSVIESINTVAHEPLVFGV